MRAGPEANGSGSAARMLASLPELCKLPARRRLTTLFSFLVG
jgi:hypothetical protein